ncbi:hypothetical protein CNBE1600 [Cryptococcus deneoformans B-3501A]|uniref:hypothetical protein n=1 Tax=Cryptococcus deneoformans (strain B-3501A) TaxID=283643 RepID=UPI000042E7C2|nr:hypothetical protein CNBE1600 [Cryptococcus neoformans var. neoformans B-3501A]EAL20798.1 hypothetical protein CNBE1600 [Cryptococcus neoformans var. neoformans B-3501A]
MTQVENTTPICDGTFVAIDNLSPQNANTSSLEPQVLLILVGLPGSGKTTFAEALVRASSMYITPPEGTGKVQPSVIRRPWMRASQDDAPSKRRQECESRVRWGLKNGYNVLVDRVGFDPVQRSHFVAIADDQLPRPLVYCLILSVSQDTLQSRLLGRESHPTIHGGEEGMRVLSQMSRLFQPPTIYGGEGLDRMYVLDEINQPSAAEGWSDQRVLEIVDRVGNDGRREVGERKNYRPAPRIHDDNASPRGASNNFRGGRRGMWGGSRIRGSWDGRGSWRSRGGYKGPSSGWSSREGSRGTGGGTGFPPASLSSHNPYNRSFGNQGAPGGA